ncbi:MAG TPA: hypothetical protein VJ729_01140 [Nitrososphaeraceae archaeon]|nr:hypothetical protein [Nitrososphaeraceae archaeon]
MLNQQQESTSNGFSCLAGEVITDVLLQSSQKRPTFVICDVCYWCATYVDSTRLPADSSSSNSSCPQCNAYSESHGGNNNNKNSTNRNRDLSRIPIRSNESFTFKYNAKRGVELEFQPRHGRR